jgi:hypothetical protein
LSLGVAVVHGSAGCTLDQSGTAATGDIFSGANATSSGSGGATGASSGAFGGGTLAGTGPTTSSGTPASSSSGMAGTEDCLDGQDNDGNGQIDCADAACQPGFECTAEAPTGWTDYVRVHTTPYGMATGINCPDGSPPLHYFEGPGGPAQCQMCSCSLMGATCGAPEISCYFGSPNCMNGVDFTQQATTAACIGNPNVSGGGTSASCRLTNNAMVLMQGTCSTSGGSVTSTPPIWAQDVLLCGGPTAGAGCPGGQVCIPKGTGDFSASACITRAGTDMCPAGWTTTDIQAYANGTDNRACSACTCNAACTGGRYTVHDLDNCDPPSGFDHADTSITSSTCVDIGGSFDNDSGSLTPELAQPSPMCAGGTPTGQVTTQEPHVICCP